MNGTTIDRIVDHYRIIDKIGSGGMGEIFLAEDTRLKRQVALKFLPRQMTADPEARQRFEREAQAAASLNHPNIVTVYEIGEHEGQVFIAMEYVEGRTLKDMIFGVGAIHESPLPITPHPLPITQVIEIAVQIASGLAAAHAKGIVHRDVKPQNIVIDRDGHVKILDFGLAKLKGASPLTQGAFAMGTVHYMSPEQGLGREVDARTDIWSLGVVLYEMLAGALPFRGDFDQAVIYAIVNEEIQPLPDRGTPLPPGLESVIRRCLAKKRQDRYPSAGNLAEALRNLGKSKETTRLEQNARRKLSRPVLLAIGSLLIFSGILGFFTFNPQARAALNRMLGTSGIPSTKHLAVLPLRVIGGDVSSRAFSDGLVETMTSKLTQFEQFARSMWIVPASEMRASGIDSPGEARKVLGVNLVVTGSLQQNPGFMRLTLNLIDADAVRQLRSAIITETGGAGADFQDRAAAEVARMLDLELKPAALSRLAVGGTSLPEANELYLRGRGLLQRYEQVENLDAAIDLFTKAVHGDPGFALAHAGLGEAYWRKYEETQDPPLAREAQRHCQRAIELNPDLVPVYVTMGIIERGSGRYPEAAARFQRALELDPVNSEALVGLASAYQKMNRPEDAEAAFRRAIELRPDYWASYNNLGFFYYRNGRFAEAIAMFHKVIALTPDNVRAFNNLGGIYSLQGKNQPARQMFEKSLSIRPNAHAYANLGTIHFFEKRYRESAAMYEKGIALGQNNYMLWGNLGDAYSRIPGAEKKAEAAYRAAIAQVKEQLRVNPKDASMRSSLALYYIMTGQDKAALGETAAARELAADDVTILLNAALVYELAGQRGLALEAIRRYLANSGPVQAIDQEPHFSRLKEDPGYQALQKETPGGRKQNE